MAEAKKRKKETINACLSIVSVMILRDMIDRATRRYTH